MDPTLAALRLLSSELAISSEEQEKLAINVGVTGRFARRMGTMSLEGIESLKGAKTLRRAKHLLKEDRRLMRGTSHASAAQTVRSRAAATGGVRDRAERVLGGHKAPPANPSWAKNTPAAVQGKAQGIEHSRMMRERTSGPSLLDRIKKVMPKSSPKPTPKSAPVRRPLLQPQPSLAFG